jgi:hypothetical protein
MLTRCRHSCPEYRFDNADPARRIVAAHCCRSTHGSTRGIRNQDLDLFVFVINSSSIHRAVLS